jgi:hypothetical protein
MAKQFRDQSTPSNQCGAPRQSSAKRTQHDPIARLQPPISICSIQGHGQGGRGGITNLLDRRDTPIRRNAKFLAKLGKHPPIGLMKNDLVEL